MAVKKADEGKPRNTVAAVMYGAQWADTIQTAIEDSQEMTLYASARGTGSRKTAASTVRKTARPRR